MIITDYADYTDCEDLRVNGTADPVYLKSV